MVGTCCIVNCRNNVPRSNERVTLFKVPNELRQFDEWSKAIETTGSLLHVNSTVCERHFHEDQITRDTLIRHSFDNVIFQKPFVELSLVRDAVPSIFHKDIPTNPTSGKKRRPPPPGQRNDCNTVGNVPEGHCSNIVVSFHEDQTSSIQYIANNSQALPTNTGSVDTVSIDRAQLAFTNCTNNGSLPGNDVQIFINPQGFHNDAGNIVRNSSENRMYNSANLDSFPVNRPQVLQRIPNTNELIPKEQVTDDEVKVTSGKRLKKNRLKSSMQHSEKETNVRSFDLIYQNSDKIKLPNSMWGYHKNDKDNNIMIFSKVRWFSTNACTLPLYERQVVFHESDELKIYINNVFSPLETPSPRNITEMEEVLSNVDKLSLCSGGPSIEFAKTAALAQKDHAVGRWRHKYCPIVVANNENICKYCSSINQVFRYPKQKRLPFGRRSRVQTDEQ